jgi:hypothetical protein
MPIERTPADRLDEALDALLAGELPCPDPALAPALAAAERLRATLAPVPAGLRFQVALADRLSDPGIGARTVRAFSHAARGRLLAAGAVSSAAVGVGVTAYAVWRTSRRHAAHRPLGR